MPVLYRSQEQEPRSYQGLNFAASRRPDRPLQVTQISNCCKWFHYSSTVFRIRCKSLMYSRRRRSDTIKTTPRNPNPNPNTTLVITQFCRRKECVTFKIQERGDPQRLAMLYKSRLLFVSKRGFNFLPSPEASNSREPAKADYSETCHSNKRKQCLLLHQGHRTIAGNALELVQRRVWLRCVHAKSKLVHNAEIAGLRSRADVFRSVVNDESVCLSEQRYSCAGLEGAGVPDDALCLLDRNIRRNGVHLVVRGTGGQYVDPRGCGGKRSVVPDECYVVFDLVVLSRQGVGCDHRNASSG